MRTVDQNAVLFLIIGFIVAESGMAHANPGSGLTLVARSDSGKERFRISVPESDCGGTSVPAGFLWRSSVYLVSLTCADDPPRMLEVLLPPQPGVPRAPIALLSPCLELPCTFGHSGAEVGLDGLHLEFVAASDD